MNPEVISGTREPQAVRLERIASRPSAPTPVTADGPGTIYVSHARRYRVQITAPKSFVNPVTGQTTVAGEELVAQFEDHVFRNDERFHRDPEVRAFVDKTLQSNRYFGPFNGASHFWLASDQRAKVEAKRREATRDYLKTLPADELKAIVAGLEQGDADDHPMPPAQKSAAKPIK